MVGRTVCHKLKKRQQISFTVEWRSVLSRPSADVLQVGPVWVGRLRQRDVAKHDRHANGPRADWADDESDVSVRGKRAEHGEETLPRDEHEEDKMATRPSEERPPLADGCQRRVVRAVQATGEVEGQGNVESHQLQRHRRNTPSKVASLQVIVFNFKY